MPVHAVTREGLLQYIAAAAMGSTTATIYYANAHASNVAAKDSQFRMALQAASLVVCDGKGIQWASRVLGTPLPERLTPPDWIDELCDLAAERGIRMSFLEAAPALHRPPRSAWSELIRDLMSGRSTASFSRNQEEVLT